MCRAKVAIRRYFVSRRGVALFRENLDGFLAGFLLASSAVSTCSIRTRRRRAAAGSAPARLATAAAARSPFATSRTPHGCAAARRRRTPALIWCPAIGCCSRRSVGRKRNGSCFWTRRRSPARTYRWPRAPQQVLLTNLFTDLPELAVATDRNDAGWIERSRRWSMAFHPPRHGDLRPGEHGVR